MDANNISAELMEKAKACQSTDELLELAKNEGYDLSDEELEAISGGEAWNPCNAKGCKVVCTSDKKTPGPSPTKLM